MPRHYQACATRDRLLDEPGITSSNRYLTAVNRARSGYIASAGSPVGQSNEPTAQSNPINVCTCFLRQFWTRIGSDVEQRTICTSESLRASTKMCLYQEKFTIFRVLTLALLLETLSRSRLVFFCVW